MDRKKAELVEGLRELHLEALAAAEKYEEMIALLEERELAPRSSRAARLSDALVPRRGRKKTTRKKGKRQLSAKGRAAISRAAKKRWAEYNAAKAKKG